MEAVEEGAGPSAVSVTPARVGAIAAIVGGISVFFEPAPAIGYIGIALAVAGTILMSLSLKATRGGMWRLVLLIGMLLALFSPIVAQGSEGLGGWMGVLGGLALICAAITGFPTRRTHGLM